MRRTLEEDEGFLMRVSPGLTHLTMALLRSGVSKWYQVSLEMILQRCVAVENHQDLASEELLWLHAPTRAGAWGVSGRSRHPKAPQATNFLQPVCRELAPSSGTTIKLNKYRW